MPRLSIVIPSPDFNGDVEDTLVSILQNRPTSSEVILVTAGRYDDPYQLSDEVEFAEENAGASILRLINRGFQEARAEIVHVVLPGVRVVEGWTEAVPACFDNPRVAAVSPALKHNTPKSLRASLGVHYRSFGVRRVVGRGLRFSASALRAAPILGPTLHAGFYRRDVVLGLGGFDENVGWELADVDMGLAMRELGYTARVAPECQVLQVATPASFESAFQRSRHAERLFHRYASKGISQTLMHGAASLASGLSYLLPHRMVASIAGRIAARWEKNPSHPLAGRIEKARSYLAERETDESLTVRGDFSRRPARTRTVSASPSRRRAA